MSGQIRSKAQGEARGQKRVGALLEKPDAGHRRAAKGLRPEAVYHPKKIVRSGTLSLR